MLLIPAKHEDTPRDSASLMAWSGFPPASVVSSERRDWSVSLFARSLRSAIAGRSGPLKATTIPRLSHNGIGVHWVTTFHFNSPNLAQTVPVASHCVIMAAAFNDSAYNAAKSLATFVRHRAAAEPSVLSISKPTRLRTFECRSESGAAVFRSFSSELLSR